MSKCVLIRCDASKKIGLGHMVRSIELARNLKSMGYEPNFILKFTFQLGIKMLVEDDLNYFLLSSYKSQTAQILKIANEKGAKVFIGDTKHGCPTLLIKKLKQIGVLTVAIDENNIYAKHCALCFYPPHANVQIREFKGKVYQGLEYTLIRKEFFEVSRRSKHTSNNFMRIFVMMGGTDTDNLLLPVLERIVVEASSNSQIITVAPKNHPDLDKFRILPKNIEIFEPTLELVKILENSDLAIVKFGTIAYELLALGIPAIHLCFTDEDFRASEWFANRGYAIKTSLQNFSLTDLSPLNFESALDVKYENMIHDTIEQELTVLERKHFHS